MRGGSYVDWIGDFAGRSANRGSRPARERSSDIGFRLVRSYVP